MFNKYGIIVDEHDLKTTKKDPDEENETIAPETVNSALKPSKLQKTNYLYEPRKMLASIHEKTMFKAAMNVAK